MNKQQIQQNRQAFKQNPGKYIANWINKEIQQQKQEITQTPKQWTKDFLGGLIPYFLLGLVLTTITIEATYCTTTNDKTNATHTRHMTHVQEQELMVGTTTTCYTDYHTAWNQYTQNNTKGIQGLKILQIWKNKNNTKTNNNTKYAWVTEQ